MTLSFNIQAITRTDNLLLVSINDTKRRALRIHRNKVKIFEQVLDLDAFGEIPIYKDSRQLTFDIDEVKEL